MDIGVVSIFWPLWIVLLCKLVFKYLFKSLLSVVLRISLGLELLSHMVVLGEGNGTPLQYSCLENPMDRGAWWAAVHGVVKQLIGKDPVAGKDWEQEEKGATEDELVGWHHWLNGHEFEQTLGDSKGQGSMVCFSSWGRRIRHNLVTEQQHSVIQYWVNKVFLEGVPGTQQHASYMWKTNRWSPCVLLSGLVDCCMGSICPSHYSIWVIFLQP